MSEVLTKAREYMKSQQVDFLLVNSTNEFLVEYNELCENSRYLLTGFSGSTGDALLAFDKLYLFVDGRYHIQADLEVNPEIVSVVKLQSGQSQLGEMAKLVPEGAIVGVCAKKNSQKRVDMMRKNFEVKLLDFDGVESAEPDLGEIVEIEWDYVGMSASEKISQIQKNLEVDEAILFTNLEDVSYLYNKRDFSKQYSSKIKGKALITKTLDELLVGEKLKHFEDFITSDIVYVDDATINARDYNLLGEKVRQMKSNPALDMRTVKTDVEISHYKDAFAKTDKAMFAIRDFIEKNENISEADIDKKLEEFFYENGAKNLSFKSIVAHNRNSALAHYSKSSKDEIIKDGSLVLIDCGAYYEGGLATDITRVFVKGEPNKLQKKVYTTVLKAFLNAYNFEMQENSSGFEIDSVVRKVFDENKIEGFVFNHGLGHGIGINVHEAPPNLSINEIAKNPIKNNMCFTIEPGLYNSEHFGVRLENSCYLNSGKIISFTNMCYEAKLIDYELLNEQEKEWLKSFEVM